MTAILASHLGNLLFPVMVYMAVLLTMGVFTLTCKRSNNWLVAGGISFILSDSLIGLNKFYMDIPQASLLIMVTYYFAQFALTKGILKSQRV
jgi:uncharacterized membrane protein YhhN